MTASCGESRGRLRISHRQGPWLRSGPGGSSTKRPPCLPQTGWEWPDLYFLCTLIFNIFFQFLALETVENRFDQRRGKISQSLRENTGRHVGS